MTLAAVEGFKNIAPCCRECRKWRRCIYPCQKWYEHQYKNLKAIEKYVKDAFKEAK